MRQHRQEFILAQIGFAQGFLDLLALGDVARSAGNGFHLAIRPDHRHEDVIVDAAAEGAGEGNFAAYRLLGCDDLLNLAVVHFRVPGFVAEFEAILPDRLFPAFAPHFQQHFIGIDEAMVQAEDIDQIGSIRQDGLVQAQPPLGLS
jgi:hypothetical protein